MTTLIGVGKGVTDVTTKIASGVLGLVAYPAHGFCKSLHTWTHSGTVKEIAAAQLVEGEYLLDRVESMDGEYGQDVDVETALATFDRLVVVVG